MRLVLLGKLVHGELVVLRSFLLNFERSIREPTRPLVSQPSLFQDLTANPLDKRHRIPLDPRPRQQQLGESRFLLPRYG